MHKSNGVKGQIILRRVQSQETRRTNREKADLQAVNQRQRKEAENPLKLKWTHWLVFLFM